MDTQGNQNDTATAVNPDQTTQPQLEIDFKKTNENQASLAPKEISPEQQILNLLGKPTNMVLDAVISVLPKPDTKLKIWAGSEERIFVVEQSLQVDNVLIAKGTILDGKMFYILKFILWDTKKIVYGVRLERRFYMQMNLT